MLTLEDLFCLEQIKSEIETKEMSERYDKLMETLPPHYQTMFSTCYSLIAKEAFNLGYKSAVSLLICTSGNYGK